MMLPTEAAFVVFDAQCVRAGAGAYPFSCTSRDALGFDLFAARPAPPADLAKGGGSDLIQAGPRHNANLARHRRKVGGGVFLRMRPVFCSSAAKNRPFLRTAVVRRYRRPPSFAGALPPSPAFSESQPTLVVQGIPIRYRWKGGGIMVLYQSIVAVVESGLMVPATKVCRCPID